MLYRHTLENRRCRSALRAVELQAKLIGVHPDTNTVTNDVAKAEQAIVKEISRDFLSKLSIING